jgi:predicted secreted protein
MSRRKKIIIIALIAIVIAVVLCGLIMKFYESKNNSNKVVLSETGGYPFVWECKVDNEDIATIEDKVTKDMNPDMQGSEIRVTYIINGIKKGKTNLHCEFIRPDTQEIAETNNYEINVDKKLNVTIINK